jgi:hypothetical protein
MAISSYFISGYWLLFHQWLLIVIILVAIGGYYKLNYHRSLMAIDI